jgi:uncharacterized RDD family membrane protein YckC
MADWYYARQGSQLGPVNREQLEAMVRSGTVAPSDLVWTDGMASWQPAGQVPGLASPAQAVQPNAYAAPMGYPQPGAPINYYSPQFTEMRYAGFWLRFCAWFIDQVILLVLGGCIGGILGGIIGGVAASSGNGPGSPGWSSTMDSVRVIGNLISVVISWLYYALQESSGVQATLGKRALGLVVTDLNGQRMSFGKATGRYFGKLISAIILLVGFFMAGWTERKQALHDIMAGTLVMKKNP